METKVQEILSREYPIALALEKTATGRELYAAYLLDLPGCIAQGDSEQEAIERLNAVKVAYIRRLMDLKVDIPRPTPFPKIVPGRLGFYDEVSGSFTPATRSMLEGSTDVRSMKLEAAGA